MTDPQIRIVYESLQRIEEKQDAALERQHKMELRVQALELSEKSRPPLPTRPCPDFVDHVKCHQKNEESVRVQAEAARQEKQRMRDRIAMVVSRAMPYALSALIASIMSKF